MGPRFHGVADTDPPRRRPVDSFSGLFDRPTGDKLNRLRYNIRSLPSWAEDGCDSKSHYNWEYKPRTVSSLKKPLEPLSPIPSKPKEEIPFYGTDV